MAATGIRAFDWNLRSCGRQGHATYAPDEPELADRLTVETPWGAAWRCLRCGDYVLGEPVGQGPASHAPVLLRGRPLRDAFVLRILAVDRLVRGVFIVSLAVGIWRFNGARVRLHDVFDTYLPLLTPLADRLGVHLVDLALVHWIERAFLAQQTTLVAVAFAVGVYGTLELVEGVGLWLMRRWGEYVAVVGTSLFLPLEIYEVAEKVTALRVAALVINIFLVGYLVWTKRLFGARGGAAAHAAELHNESLLEVERSAARHP